MLVDVPHEPNPTNESCPMRWSPITDLSSLVVEVWNQAGIARDGIQKVCQ